MLIPSNIVKLSGFVVLRIEESDINYILHAESSNPPNTCIHCKSRKIRGFGRRKRLIKDLPINGKRVGIYVSARRYQCVYCYKTFYETLPEVDERRAMTKRLVAWITKQAINRTFASLAEDVGVTEGTVRAVFRDYLSRVPV